MSKFTRTFFGLCCLAMAGYSLAQSNVGNFNASVTIQGPVTQTATGSGVTQDINIGSAKTSQANSFTAVVTTGSITQTGNNGAQQFINVGGMKDSKANNFNAKVTTGNITQTAQKGERQEIDVGSATNSTINGDMTVNVRTGDINQTGKGEIAIGAVKNSTVSGFTKTLVHTQAISGHNVRIGSIVGQQRYDNQGGLVGREPTGSEQFSSLPNFGTTWEKVKYNAWISFEDSANRAARPFVAVAGVGVGTVKYGIDLAVGIKDFSVDAWGNKKQIAQNSIDAVRNATHHVYWAASNPNEFLTLTQNELSKIRDANYRELGDKGLQFALDVADRAKDSTVAYYNDCFNSSMSACYQASVKVGESGVPVDLALTFVSGGTYGAANAATKVGKVSKYVDSVSDDANKLTKTDFARTQGASIEYARTKDAYNEIILNGKPDPGNSWLLDNKIRGVAGPKGSNLIAQVRIKSSGKGDYYRRHANKELFNNNLLQEGIRKNLPDGDSIIFHKNKNPEIVHLDGSITKLQWHHSPNHIGTVSLIPKKIHQEYKTALHYEGIKGGENLFNIKSTR
jgi:hypothetical protein